MIRPPWTTTAPIGTSSALKAFPACRKASRMKAASISSVLTAAEYTGARAVIQPDAPSFAKSVYEDLPRRLAHVRVARRQRERRNGTGSGQSLGKYPARFSQDSRNADPRERAAQRERTRDFNGGEGRLRPERQRWPGSRCRTHR